MPSTSSAPKPRTIGTGESSSTRKPTAVAIPAVRIVGPARRGGGRCGRERARRARSAPARRARLVEARLELDRVVDGEPDQHGQHRDRRHREAAAGERQRAEGHRRGRQRERERQQPQARAEDERERRRHQQQRGGEQHEDRALHGVGEALGHHRHAGHDVARALLRPERALARRLLDQRDRPPALLLAQVRAACAPGSARRSSRGRGRRSATSARPTSPARVSKTSAETKLGSSTRGTSVSP